MVVALVVAYEQQSHLALISGLRGSGEVVHARRHPAALHLIVVRGGRLEPVHVALVPVVVGCQTGGRVVQHTCQGIGARTYTHPGARSVRAGLPAYINRGGGVDEQIGSRHRAGPGRAHREPRSLIGSVALVGVDNIGLGILLATDGGCSALHYLDLAERRYLALGLGGHHADYQQSRQT